MITMSRLGKDGQIGNQLFQYAMLFAVARKKGYELRIPKNYDGVKQRDMVELAPLSITAGELRPEDMKQIKNTFVHERVKYNPDVFNQPDGTDFRGWYQTEKYFADVADDIRQEFRFKPVIADPVATFMSTLAAGGREIISLHVRRGDYVQHANKFRVLASSYYREALEYVLTNSTFPTEPVVAVFSDEIAWCRANLQFPQNVIPSFIVNPTHWHDLCAMTMCSHHIIGASSFSWWGAYMAERPGQVVVAPKPWFNSGLPEDTSDMVPERWHQLTTMENYQ